MFLRIFLLMFCLFSQMYTMQLQTPIIKVNSNLFAQIYYATQELTQSNALVKYEENLFIKIKKNVEKENLKEAIENRNPLEIIRILKEGYVDANVIFKEKSNKSEFIYEPCYSLNLDGSYSHFYNFSRASFSRASYETPLVLACKKNFPEIVLLLIELGADVNKYSEYYFDNTAKNGTPLFFAAEFNKTTDIMKLLIQKGANVHYKNCNQETPLSTICSFPHRKNTIAKVQLLLNAGANVNEQDCFGKTALFYACKEYRDSITKNENELKLIQLLLDYGADVSIKNRNEETVLDQFGENKDLRDILLKHQAKITFYKNLD